MNNNDITSPTFVRGLKAVEGDAWDQFYFQYAPMILAFAKKKGCSDTLAEDVLQETIVALYRVLPKFEYDREKGKFRSFLFRVTSTKVVDAYRRGKRLVSIEDSEAIDKFHSDIEPYTATSDEWNETWDNNLLGMAIDFAQARVKPMTFECFERTFVKGEAVADVAAGLEIDANLVYQHRHKVQQIIVKEARRIKEEYGE